MGNEEASNTENKFNETQAVVKSNGLSKSFKKVSASFIKDPGQAQDLDDDLKVGYTPETFSGGCISSILYVILTAYFISRMMKIFAENREHVYNATDIYYQEEQMNEFDITLGGFNNTMNFIFGLDGEGLRNGTTDIENNPYVRFISL